MTLCTSLFGVFMLFHGFIRDYIANGVTRIEMYLLLSHGFIWLRNLIGQPIRDDLIPIPVMKPIKLELRFTWNK